MKVNYLVNMLCLGCAAAVFSPYPGNYLRFADVFLYGDL